MTHVSFNILHSLGSQRRASPARPPADSYVTPDRPVEARKTAAPGPVLLLLPVPKATVPHS